MSTNLPISTVLDEKRDRDAFEEPQEDLPAKNLSEAISQGRVHVLSSEDRAAALRYAQSIDPGLKPFSPRWFWFIWIGLTACMCGGDNGFDGTVMSAVNSMSQWYNYFGLGQATAGTGVVFGMYTVGTVSAFFPLAILPDKIGRRYSMFLGNLCLLAGVLITTFANHMPQFFGGRFLTGLGCTTAVVSAISYLAEVTSPHNRGLWLGFMYSFYYVGQIAASGVAIPFGHRSDTWSWRAPIFLQAGPAVINLIFVLFVPESPRWLFAQGHRERALHILAKLHSRDGDINSPLIQLEIQEIAHAVDLHGADKRWWDFRAVFRTRGDRYRFGLTAICSSWSQLSGNGLITYFLPTLLRLAGIKDSDQQRKLNLVNSCTSFIGALGGTSIVDRVGRRKLMLFATVWCMCGMGIVAGLLSKTGPQSTMRANAGISFIFLFMVGFSFGWTPLQGTYPSEVLAFENRAKGLALQRVVTSTVSLINTFGLPSALTAIDWKTYLIFMCWDIVGFVLVYLFIVETKQLSLEEVDSIFQSPHPKQQSFKLAAEARRRAKEEREALEGL